MQLKNLLTFDVEDYYHLFYRNQLNRDLEPTQEVENCTRLILDILTEKEVHATFFIVGKVALRFPELVRKIVAAGHEVASHGYEHIYVNQIGKDRFRNDLKKSKHVIEDLIGSQVYGFRAPEFSVDDSTPWAFEVLAEIGFKYDSSLFPVKGRRYGSEGIPQTTYDIDTSSGTIREIPLSSVTILKKRIPAAGGGYLRVFPFWFNCWAIRRMNQEGRPAVVYMHPYEFATRPLPIRFNGNGLSRHFNALLQHRKQLINRSQSSTKLEYLVKTFKFQTISDFLGLN
jgi:polysaccharide deacetylase family protein (PEP-CTERM system associated)